MQGDAARTFELSTSRAVSWWKDDAARVAEGSQQAGPGTQKSRAKGRAEAGGMRKVEAKSERELQAVLGETVWAQGKSGVGLGMTEGAFAPHLELAIPHRKVSAIKLVVVFGLRM